MIYHIKVTWGTPEVSMASVYFYIKKDNNPQFRFMCTASIYFFIKKDNKKQTLNGALTISQSTQFLLSIDKQNDS